MSTFVILGGTGKVGRRLSRLVSDAGHTARPVGRTSEPRFDWRDESTWSGALAGGDGVFIVGPGSATDWSPLLTGFLERAATAGVEHAVLLSARGVEFLPDGAVAGSEAALQAGPLAWTILRPTHFAQNFTEAMFVPDHGTIVAPVGDGAEPFIDVEDLAAVAAEVLIGRRHDGAIVALSGPAALTFPEAAAVLESVTGQPTRFRSESDESHVERLRAAGTPEGYLRWRMAMLGGIRTGADAYVSDGVQAVLGRPATSFTQWAAREVRPVTPDKSATPGDHRR